MITTILDPSGGPRGRAGRRLPPAVGTRDREPAGQDLPARPGKVLRSQSPEGVYQEIWGYLLTHHAIAALICAAATAAGIDPDRVRFTRTVRVLRRQVADPPAFSP
ncbi:hypothetical protein FrEUN1fDRAFT_5400 [Parafrankia sp. EUN1f]|nr:hypothetical protein FrEUN1fDRAFT_5400 [Parafrankia sp. EUN1f]